MDNLKIADSKDHFTIGGKSFFYLADTAWSSFTNASLDEWEEYLDYRKMQNFNVLQINILPQWDRSGEELPLEITPFAVKENGLYDFSKFNEAYFSKAQRMLDMAVERGFIPALVVLWCDFVKDTWASSRVPDHFMPIDAVKPYVQYAIEKFARYNPIYLVSGDTDFPSEESNRYYKTALETIKQACPNALTTLHIAGRLTELPEQFINSPDLDFYMYQSCHYAQEQQLPYKMAQEFCKKTVVRPVLNGEPCYEGHGYGNSYGRFNAFDVRKAVWQSLLSGAKAGITYGAHGIWSWHSKERNFGNAAFSSKPYNWKEALHFKGAWDAAFAKYIFELYELFDITPRDIILNNTEEIRCAISKDADKIAVYVPYSDDITLDMDLSEYNLTLIDLENKLFAKPGITVDCGKSTIKMGGFTADVLILGIRNRQ